jgi:chromosome partitioning protein
VTTIAVASVKGGSGKSTISVHLAVAAMRAGEKVALLDCDPQGSAAAWHAARELGEPYVASVDPADLAKALAKARSGGYSVVIVDTQPRLAASLTNLARATDYVLSPMQPTPFDLDTADSVRRIVTAAGVQYAFILSRCPARSPDVALARATLEEIGPVFDEAVGDRRIYARSLQTGRSCQEYEPTSDAALEIGRVWSELARRANVVSTSSSEA